MTSRSEFQCVGTFASTPARSFTRWRLRQGLFPTTLTWHSLLERWDDRILLASHVVLLVLSHDRQNDVRLRQLAELRAARLKCRSLHQPSIVLHLLSMQLQSLRERDQEELKLARKGDSES